ncbi:MAG: hypothetical protein RUMPE_01199 [Eubacteriales bacterium SKADARSKE-1]|nr:hypothetical protein [Eubacteriales bacterium SKADARSKE-1]MDQ5984163.1 hypothetical protein [Eubacteriales bacterium SKADARSKE-1]
MKKVLSSILIGSMLISSMGAISIFADETETSVSATTEANSEASSTETELGEAIGKLKENITKFEVKSFWRRNKGKILKVTGGALAAAMGVTAAYFVYRYSGVSVPDESMANNFNGVKNDVASNESVEGKSQTIVTIKARHPVEPTVKKDKVINAALVEPTIVDFKSLQPISPVKGFEPNYCLGNSTTETYLEPHPEVSAVKAVETEDVSANQDLGPFITYMKKLYFCANSNEDRAVEDQLKAYLAAKGIAANKAFTIAENEYKKNPNDLLIKKQYYEARKNYVIKLDIELNFLIKISTCERPLSRVFGSNQMNCNFENEQLYDIKEKYDQDYLYFEHNERDDLAFNQLRETRQKLCDVIERSSRCFGDSMNMRDEEEKKELFNILLGVGVAVVLGLSPAALILFC